MRFFNPLFRLTQCAHALMQHWSILCEEHALSEGTDGDGGQLHAASLQEFLGMLQTERAALTEQLDILEHEVVLAIKLTEVFGACTYKKLCQLMQEFGPYFTAYPDLQREALMECLWKNTLNKEYPLP